MMLGFLGAIAYVAVAIAAFSAAMGLRRPVHPRLLAIRRWWLWVGVFFLVLTAWRLGGWEEATRTLMRDLLARRGLWEDRWALQAPIAAVLLLASAAAFAWAFVRGRKAVRNRLEQRVLWGILGSAAMVLLVVVRLSSFHVTDGLLYGPLHLNRVVDPLLAAFVLWHAVRFRHQARALRGADGRG